MKKAVIYEGKEYHYLFTFGVSGHVYGNGDDRIVVGEQGKMEMRYNIKDKDIVMPSRVN